MFRGLTITAVELVLLGLVGRIGVVDSSLVTAGNLSISHIEVGG